MVAGAVKGWAGHEGGLAVPAKLGIIGAGNIIGQYLDTFAAAYPEVEVVAVAAAHLDRARAVAEPHGLLACDVAELLADPGIELVVNLTPAAAHTEVSRAVIAAGKHLYTEKPLALTPEVGSELLAAAAAAGVRVGCAPDTFLGTGLQTTARALRAGLIGEPFAAMAIWGSDGPEGWHPNPQIFYSAGGGPVLDMGPYYVTALVTHLGPVVSVSARSRTTARRRIVGSGPLAGAPIKVEVPTYATAILEHESGVLATVILSFETRGIMRRLEISGTAGRLLLPDPGVFSGRGSVQRLNAPGRWTELPDSAGYVATGRGIGAIELLRSAAAGRTPRASGLLALHVTEILCAINESAAGPVGIASRPDVPERVELATAGQAPRGGQG